METESDLLYQPMTSTISKRDRTAGTTAISETAIVTSPPCMMHPQMVGPTNTLTVCNFCFASVKTSTKHTVTARTHLTAAICSLATCCLCFCIPYCIDSTKNTDHYCPNCERYLGTYKK